MAKISSRRRQGFTLYEMIGIIAVIAAFSSIALPVADNFMSGARTSAEAATLVSDIRLGRYEAIRTQQVNKMDLTNLATNTYTLQTFTKTVESNPSPSDLANASNWENLMESENRELSVEVIITKPAALKALFFRPDGVIVSNWSPQDPGLPISPVAVSLNYGSATMTVMISGSGALTSEDYYEE